MRCFVVVVLFDCFFVVVVFFVVVFFCCCCLFFSCTRTRLDTMNLVEILLTGKMCKFNVFFISTEISRVSFSGGYWITRGCFFVFFLGGGGGCCCFVQIFKL